MLIAGILSAALFVGCSAREGSAADFSVELYKPQYAGGFEILGKEGSASTLIRVRDPWQGADSVVTELFIARGGEDAPAGFEGQVLEGDARRIVAMSSTHIAMLDAFGAVRTVVGVSGIDYIFNRDIQARRDSVGDVGYEGNVNYERLMSLDPDLVLLYGVNGASSMEGKLRELGIPYMYVGDYLEDSPLGKAEWLVALAEITGRREAGVKAFAGIPERYNALKQKVEAAGLDRPKILLNTPYNDAWMMPPVDSYAARLVRDAGGVLAYDRNTSNSSVAVDMEEAYMLADQAYAWLNTGAANTLEDVAALCPKFTDTPPFREGRIYNNNLRSTPAGGNDYFESAGVNPDLVLRDMVRIFHPELVEEDFVYYKKLN